jgi:hypothetical protein
MRTLRNYVENENGPHYCRPYQEGIIINTHIQTLRTKVRSAYGINSYFYQFSVSAFIRVKRAKPCEQSVPVQFLIKRLSAFIRLRVRFMRFAQVVIQAQEHLKFIQFFERSCHQI